MVDRRADDRSADTGTGQPAPKPKTLGREVPALGAHGLIDDGAREESARHWSARRRHIVLGLAGALTAVGLLAAGLWTHFDVRDGRLATVDAPLMRMQRMGPPPGLQNAYEILNSDTVAIRDPATGPVVATGIYTEFLVNPATLPAFSSFLPSTLKHLIEFGQARTYAAIFVTPLRGLNSRRVQVDTSALQLPGVVVGVDKALGLAAVAATVNQDQLSGIDSSLPFFRLPPAGTFPLRQLIVRRNPDSYHRAAGFVLTRGVLRDGQESCDTLISGADSGAPVAYVSPSGGLSLAGLALPSPVPGRCTILGAWNISQFLVFLTSSKPGRQVTYLGVATESPAAARREKGYQGPLRGVYVSSVVPGSPAAKVELRPGDVIIRIGADAVNSLATMRADIRNLRPGSIHTVTFVRGGRTYTVRVVFAAIPVSAESG